MNTDHLMANMEEIVREAGKIILSAHLDRDEVIRKSGHQNFVTEYDRRVQDFLEEKLHAVLPEASFYAEEDENRDVNLRDGYVFIIDPIDGTSNFMKGLYPSCISVGLFLDGSPYAGMVYVPYSDDLFCAVRGRGAVKNGREIRASQDPLSFSLALFGTSPYYEKSLVDRAYATARFYQERCIDVRRSGSAAYDLCMVACGVAGIYTEPLIQLWDYAAGALVAQEAGAVVTSLEGKPLAYNGPSSVVAASPGAAAEPYLPAEEDLVL